MRIKAHAGCENTVPNTIESLKTAVKARADIIEIDLQRTVDGTLIASHDDMVRGRRTARLTRGQVRELAPEIPDLAEALAFLRAFQGTINLDFKTPGLFADAARVSREAGCAGQLVLTGIDPNEVAVCRRYFPTQPIWLSAPYYPSGVPRERYAAFVTECCADAVRSGCEDLNIEYRSCAGPLMDSARARGLRVHVWTVDDAHAMREMLRLGVDSITTNKITLLRQICREAGETL